MSSWKKILRTIPCASRELAARCLSSLLGAVVSTIPMFPGWIFTFLHRIVWGCHQEGGRFCPLLQYLTTTLEVQQEAWVKWITSIDNPLGNNNFKKRHKIVTDEDRMKALAWRVSAKIEEGNFKRAMCLICAEDTIADYSEDTFMTL